MTLLPKPAPKVNYLNNRDILKEIHLSKNSYCWFQDRALDHQFDLILPSVDRINQRTVAEARRNRADRIRRETGEEINDKKIPNTDVVFRVTAWEHIPKAPKKITKAEAKKKILEEIKKFNRTELETLYMILMDHSESLSENKNGIFFDLMNISDEAFGHIKEYIEFCLKTRREHEDRLKELETIRIQNENYVDEDSN
jgi:RNase P protein component